MSTVREDDLFVLTVQEVEANLHQFKNPVPGSSAGSGIDFNEESDINVQVAILTLGFTFVGQLISERDYYQELLDRSRRGQNKPSFYFPLQRKAAEFSEQKAVSIRNLQVQLDQVTTSSSSEALESLRASLPPNIHLRVGEGDDSQLWSFPVEELDGWSLISASKTAP